MGVCPGQVFGMAKAAAMMPTVLGIAAATDMILAGKGMAAVLARGGGYGESEGGHEVRQQREARPEPAYRGLPHATLSEPGHRCNRPQALASST